MPQRRAGFKQELNHQLFGSPNRPVRHAGRSLLRGGVNLTNSVVNEVLSSLLGFGRPPRKRRKRRRRRR